MNFELHAALARQTEQEIKQRTRATRPTQRRTGDRRSRATLRAVRLDG
jgi:hypothetical protein